MRVWCLLAAAFAWAETPAVVVTTSAVTHEPGLPNAGGIASLYVAGLSVAGIVAAEGTPLPTSLAGVTVDVCGAAAPLFAVADLDGYQQVNFQVPWDARFTSDGSSLRCTVTVRQGSFEGVQLATVRNSVAGDLFFTPDFIGLFQHGAGYVPVTRDLPARPGEALIVYAAALGPTQPAVAAGAAAPFTPLAVVPQAHSASAWRTITLYVDERPVMPFFAGLAPGLVGIYQLNFFVPFETGAGDHRFQLAIGWCGAFHGSGCQGPTSYTFSNPVTLPVAAVAQAGDSR